LDLEHLATNGKFADAANMVSFTGVRRFDAISLGDLTKTLVHQCHRRSREPDARQLGADERQPPLFRMKKEEARQRQIGRKFQGNKAESVGAPTDFVV
jgi:hypothetical protein